MDTDRKFRILIADRNRHVRQFLRRELESEGYAIDEARDGRELSASLNGEPSPDLLVLDPEIPFLAGVHVGEMARTRRGLIPTLIHAFAENMDLPGPRTGTVVVEKVGDTDSLKRAIRDSLRASYPQEFAAPAGQGG